MNTLIITNWNTGTKRCLYGFWIYKEDLSELKIYTRNFSQEFEHEFINNRMSRFA